MGKFWDQKGGREEGGKRGNCSRNPTELGNKGAQTENPSPTPATKKKGGGIELMQNMWPLMKNTATMYLLQGKLKTLSQVKKEKSQNA